MTFAQNFRLANYLLALLGIMALVISEFLPLPTLFLPLLAIGLAEQPRLNAWVRSVPQVFWTGLTLALFAYYLIFVFILGEDLIAAVIYFTIFVQLLRVATGTKNRDFFQIYVLAFMHLIAATMISNDVLFILPFAMFIVLAPWTFTLYNLKVQFERHHDAPRLEAMMNSKQVIGGKFFTLTAVLSLLLLVNTLAVFFLFPRVSFGFLFKRVKATGAVSGFSEKVDLSSFGEIKQSDAIVMRVEPLANPVTDWENLYWRGLAYDNYLGKRWDRSNDQKHKLNVDVYSGGVNLESKQPSAPFRYKIFLEPLETQTLFAADYLTALSWDKLQIERMLRTDFSVSIDNFRSLYFNSGIASDRIYIGSSLVTAPSVEKLRTDNFDNSAEGRAALDKYLAVPDFSPRFFELARSIGGDLKSVYDRAQAVTVYLRQQYQYTLNVPRASGEPIEDFLFRSKQGHCEYFATSGVLLMRALNVPARLVSGFRGGDWNEYGKHLTVRQRDAHTWIEVWFPSYGWQRFDPTPPDNTARGFKTIRFAALRKLFDFVELRWYKYIVSYDLQSQYQIATGLWKKASVSMRGMDKFESGDGVLKRLFAKLKKPKSGDALGGATLLFAAGLLAAAVGLIWLLIRGARRLFGRKQGTSQQGAEVYYFNRYCALLQRKGVPRQQHQTAREFQKQVVKIYPEVEDSGDSFVASYYRARFGARPSSPDELRRMRELLDQVKRLPRRNL